MANEELKQKILQAIASVLEENDIEVDPDLADLKRVDDNTFQLKVILTINEDEDEDEDDDNGEGLQPEAEESDFDD
jgi:hypothetical protein